MVGKAAVTLTLSGLAPKTTYRSVCFRGAPGALTRQQLAVSSSPPCVVFCGWRQRPSFAHATLLTRWHACPIGVQVHHNRS